MSNAIKAQRLLSQRKNTSHVLHLLLCIPTFGFWLPVWLLVAISNSLENSRIDRALARLEREE